jgi:acyl-CoA thioesterase FadM
LAAVPETRPTVRYTIRGIELDASRSVSPGWLSRIFEDTRWRVFAMEGYALRGLMTGGVARAGTYEYASPLAFGEEVDITTWVARVGRTSFDFGHRIVRVSDGAIAATARMTVVNLGPDGPAPVDPIVHCYVVDETAPRVRPFPEGSRTDAWSREWVVRPSDQDSFQHVNQARYVDYIDDTRWFAAEAGARAGLRGRLDALTVEYVREAHAGDRVRMETWCTGEGARAFELTRTSDGVVLTRGQAFADAR